MPDSAIARCICGGVEMVARFPSRFVAHCYCQPHANSFAEERPEWAPYHEF